MVKTQRPPAKFNSYIFEQADSNFADVETQTREKELLSTWEKNV